MRYVLVLIVIIASALPTCAQTTQPEGDSPVVIRTYNVSDLVRASRNYPLPGAEPKEGEPAPDEALPLVDISGITQLIMDTVQSDSWQDNGGSFGKIKSLSNVLIVTQTEAAHKEIQQLLNLLRRELGPASMVCVRAYLVSLTPEEAAAMLDKSRAAIIDAPEVPDAMLDKSRIYCQMQTICFSGQTVHVSSGREQSIVDDFESIVGSGSVGIDPTVTRVLSGVRLQVCPQVIPEASMAVLDITSTVSEAMPPEQVAITGGTSTSPQNISAKIDRENVLRQNVQTTARVPLGKRVLIGGMTFEPMKQDGRQLYLVVQLSAVQ